MSYNKVNLLTAAKLAASLTITFLFACPTAYGQGRDYKSIWNHPSKRAEVVAKYYPDLRETELQNANNVKKFVLLQIREAYQDGRAMFMWQSMDEKQMEKPGYIESMFKKAKSDKYADFDDIDKLIPVIDQLYVDEANAGIPIVQMWKLAIDKLYGEDIEQRIKNIRGVITRAEQDRKK
jgi:hypothetical protein